MLVLENGVYTVSGEPDALVSRELSYEEQVVFLIRQKYSLEDELALQRQRHTKPEEFSAYYEYCEACKHQAKAL